MKHVPAEKNEAPADAQQISPKVFTSNRHGPGFEPIDVAGRRVGRGPSDHHDNRQGFTAGSEP